MCSLSGGPCSDTRIKISESECKVMKLESMAGLKAKEKAALEKEKGKLARFRGELVELERDLKEKQFKHDAMLAAAAAKAEKAKHEEEVNRVMSEAGVMKLCEIRGKFQKKFDNTSDKHDAIWEAIADEFKRSADKGEVAQSDVGSAPALAKRFQTELGEFRLWCAKAD